MSSAGNIWGKLLQDEAINDVADNLFCSATVRSSKDEGVQGRGAEQYLSKLVGRGKRKRVDEKEEHVDERRIVEGGFKSTEGQVAEHHRPTRIFESDSEVSSDGLSDDSKKYVRENAKNKKLKSKRQYEAFRNAMIESNEAPAPKMRKVETTVKESIVGEVKDKEEGNEASSQPPQEVVKRWRVKHMDILTKKDNQGVVYYLKSRLNEKKLFLIQNAVSIFGRDTCIGIFLKSMKIIHSGGLRVKRGNKDRTRGGIFMYLIKNAKRIPEAKKLEFLTINEKSELEIKEKQKMANYQKAKDGKEKMDYMQSNILKRLNPGKPRVNNVWNLDDNDDYTMTRPQPPPQPKPEDLQPKRKTVDYADLFEDSAFLHKSFDEANF